LGREKDPDKRDPRSKKKELLRKREKGVRRWGKRNRKGKPIRFDVHKEKEWSGTLKKKT